MVAFIYFFEPKENIINNLKIPQGIQTTTSHRESYFGSNTETPKTKVSEKNTDPFELDNEQPYCDP